MHAGRHVVKRLPTIAIAAMLALMTVGVSEAPATVEEQRARLPPAAECPSPVAGKWKSLSFDERQRTWYEYVLEVREDPKDPSILSGTITVDAWEGPEDSPEPPVPCRRRFRGKMPGHGSFVHGEVAFGGGEFELIGTECGADPVYNPDQFTGTLDPVRHEFQAVNNDGGDAVNEPAVFRRIGCVDSERKQAGSDVAPPPFFPKHRSSGC